MSAEQLRDSILYVADQLNDQMFGPSIDVYTPPYATGNKPTNVPISGPLDGANRRSIYIKVRRNFFDPFLKTFDFPEPGKSIGRRNVTLVPSQSLAMMNSPLVKTVAERWGTQIELQATQTTDHDRIHRLFLKVIGRQPTVDEQSTFEDLISELGQTIESDSERWQYVVQVLLNHPDFIWIE